jgi:hypothetical protein
VNNTVFSQNELYWYEDYPGHCTFSASLYDTLYNPLTIEVTTSLGEVQGSVALPDTITSFDVSPGSPVVGEAITLSWSGGQWDFVHLSGAYSYFEQYQYYYVVLDTFVSGNSITYPDSMFLYPGTVWIYDILTYNGPYPEVDSLGNMTGDGSGFLYYINNSMFNWVYRDIPVGGGP